MLSVPGALHHWTVVSSLLHRVDSAAPSTSQSENLAGSGAHGQSQTVPVAPMLENSGPIISIFALLVQGSLQVMTALLGIRHCL